MDNSFKFECQMCGKFFEATPDALIDVELIKDLPDADADGCEAWKYSEDDFKPENQTEEGVLILCKECQDVDVY